jgi:hypothetical protein
MPVGKEPFEVFAYLRGRQYLGGITESLWMVSKTKDCYLFLLIIEIKVNIISPG